MNASRDKIRAPLGRPTDTDVSPGTAPGSRHRPVADSRRPSPPVSRPRTRLPTPSTDLLERLFCFLCPTWKLAAMREPEERAHRDAVLNSALTS